MRGLLAVAVVALSVPALALAAGQAMSPIVSAKLKGSNEVPDKGDRDGTGFVVVTFNEVITPATNATPSRISTSKG